MKNSALSVPIGLSLALGIVHCGGASDPVAGGTGTGNPGGSVVVSMLADTGIDLTTLSKVSANPSSSDAPNAGPPSFAGRGVAIHDAGGMPIAIDTAYLRVKRIHILLDSSEDAAQLASGFPGARQHDSEGFILDEPFVFELVSGTSIPAACTLSLPEAKYRGIKLKSDSGAHAQPGSTYDVTLVGRYQYNDTTYAFRIGLDMPAPVIINRANAPVAVSHIDTTHFQVVFDAGTWFVDADLKGCIDNGSLPRQPNGELVVTTPPSSGSCTGILDNIRQNLVAHVGLRAF
jgi:hypothetical protein